MSNFLKIKKNINSVVKYEAGISKLADRKKVVKLSSNEGAFGASTKVKKKSALAVLARKLRFKSAIHM